MSIIQVVLVDDHELMRQGLRAILELEDGIRISGEANSGEMLLQHVQKGLRPDVILMDLQMKGCISSLGESESRSKALVKVVRENGGTNG